MASPYKLLAQIERDDPQQRWLASVYLNNIGVSKDFFLLEEAVDFVTSTIKELGT